MRRKAPPQRVISSISHVALLQDTHVEEETLPYYDPIQYYSVPVGDVFNTRHRVSGKLGDGAYPTSWLCQDAQ